MNRLQLEGRVLFREQEDGPLVLDTLYPYAWDAYFPFGYEQVARALTAKDIIIGHHTSHHQKAETKEDDAPRYTQEKEARLRAILRAASMDQEYTPIKTVYYQTKGGHIHQTKGGHIHQTKGGHILAAVIPCDQKVDEKHLRVCQKIKLAKLIKE